MHFFYISEIGIENVKLVLQHLDSCTETTEKSFIFIDICFYTIIMWLFNLVVIVYYCTIKMHYFVYDEDINLLHMYGKLLWNLLYYYINMSINNLTSIKFWQKATMHDAYAWMPKGFEIHANSAEVKVWSDTNKKIRTQ